MNPYLVIILLIFQISAESNGEKTLQDTIFIILSQPDEFHTKLATETRNRLVDQIPNAEVYDATKDLHAHGSWTIFPLLLELSSKLKIASRAKWFVFLDVNSEVNANELANVLEKHDNDHFIGFALQDSSHTIIHHFQDPKSLEYPNFSSGFILSSEVVRDVGLSMAQHGRHLDWLPSDFSIDPQYELAKALKSRDKRHVLTHEPKLCLSNNHGDFTCAIRPKHTDCGSSEESIGKLNDKTLFAVKTCQKYHSERLPVIKQTWARAASNIMYFSEVTDPAWETIQLDNVQNTERGHCQKTMAIIEYFHKHASSKGWEWLVIADDDTILSVFRLLDHLHCYDADSPIHLGQRYGYRIAYGSHGYDYITGGGGMIFSKKIVEKIVTKKSCKCKQADTPDDMHLGACVTNLGLSVVHSSKFHQARPEDYSLDYLKEDPISFHKFWNTDPYKIYNDWFRQADEKYVKKSIQHEEL